MSDGGDEYAALAGFTVDTFTAHLGDTFRVGDLDAELIEATRHGPAPTRQQFSLVFRGPSEPVLPQRIHPLSHPVLGAFELFLVPIGPDAGGMRYEAVFA